MAPKEGLGPQVSQTCFKDWVASGGKRLFPGADWCLCKRELELGVGRGMSSPLLWGVMEQRPESGQQNPHVSSSC